MNQKSAIQIKKKKEKKRKKKKDHALQKPKRRPLVCRMTAVLLC